MLKKIFEETYQTGGDIWSSPAVGADGTIYVGSLDKYLYALTSSSQGLAKSPWPKFHHDNQNTGRIGIISLLVVDAGMDKTICHPNNGGKTQIGGNPTASGGTSPYTYNWTPTTGLDNPNIANPTASPTTTTTYTVTVTDSSVPPQQKSDSVTVTVKPEVIADAGVDKSINQGESTTIGGNPTASGGTPPYTYSWQPTATLDNPTKSNPTATPTTTTTYTVTVTDDRGCFDTDEVTVSVGSPVLIVNAGTDQTICHPNNGGKVQIGGNPTASGGTPPYTYSWTPTTGLDNPNIANPMASPTTTTTYTVTVTDKGTPPQQKSDSVTITVNPEVIANAGVDKSINQGESTTIGGNPTASGGTPPYTYSWQPTATLDNPTSSNPTATPTTTTTYTVTVTDALGCSDTDDVIVSVIPSTSATIKPVADSPQLAGAEFTVDIEVEDVTNLFGLSFVLNYDTTYIDALSAEKGDFLGSDVIFLDPVIDDGQGTVSIGITRKYPAQGVDGSGVVARITVKSGPTTPNGISVDFTITDIVANDSDGIPISLTPQPLYVIIISECLRGDVSGNGTISAYDASLILRFVVGLIDKFPADTSPNSSTSRNYSISVPHLTIAAGSRINVPITINDASGVTSGGITLRYDPNVLRPVNVFTSDMLSGYYWESNIKRKGEVRIAFAGSQTLLGESALFYLVINIEERESSSYPITTNA